MFVSYWQVSFQSHYWSHSSILQEHVLSATSCTWLLQPWDACGRNSWSLSKNLTLILTKIPLFWEKITSYYYFPNVLSFQGYWIHLSYRPIPESLHIDLYQVLLLAFPLSRNLGQRTIEIPPYFLRFFSLAKYHSWLLLIEIFPTTVTILNPIPRSKFMASRIS